MYYSKFVFSPGETGKEAGLLDWENIYQHHQFIWGLFDRSDHEAQQKADFIFKIEELANTPIIHLLSAQPPLEKINRWQVTTQPWQPVLDNGALLQFSLRINPVITVQGKRHDIFLHAKKSFHENEQAPLHEVLTTTGTDFLLNRAKSWGVEFLPGAISFSNNQTRQGIKKSKGEQNQSESIRISMVDYQGLLKVENPELFGTMLKRGFGHAKRFGCGLMLVNKIS